MYCPSAFRQTDLPTLHAHMRANPLALICSQSAQGLQASHLPLLLMAEEGEHGTLYGHFARANPHWKALADSGECLVVFGGANAYVHPGWYPSKAEDGRAVPTWNSISVQARGAVELFDEPQRLRQLVGRLSAEHEQGRTQPWSIDEAPADYLDAMLRAIVGFALPIRNLEGKWKLGQNRSTTDQAGVRAGLAASAHPRERELATHLNAYD